MVQVPGSGQSLHFDPPAVSVILCTYNRAQKLGETLPQFGKIKIPPSLTWELVIVDNRSNDDTKAVIENIAQVTGLPIRYYYEAMPGLGAARNAGIQVASGPILAFTDDDCIPEPDWLLRILEHFTSEPELDGLGGRVELFNSKDFPMSIRIRRERFDLRSPSDLLSSILGCNMAFRRKVFERIGVFDPALGAGGPLISAEDFEFLYRAVREGLRLSYFPDIVVYHDHGRRLESQIRSLEKSYVIGRGAVYFKYCSQGDKLMMRVAYWELLGLLKSLAKNALSFHSVVPQLRDLRYLITGAVLAARWRFSQTKRYLNKVNIR